MSCINTNLPYFKELQTKLNVAAPVLKLILHKLQRDRGNLDISPEEIDLWLQGDSVEFGENSLKLYEQSYKEPIIVNEEEYANALALAKAAFPAEAVRSYQGVDGRYVIRVAEPTNGILKNAKRDSEGRLLANNGKVSNLTELQYVQVRTPQFKRWFGDWLRSPETASKVVDENGEPLVVYHGTDTEFTVFDSSKNDSSYKGFYFTDSKKMGGSYKGDILMPVFLNIRDYYKVDAKGKAWNNISTSIAGHNSNSALEWLENIVKQNSLELEKAKRGIYDIFSGTYIKDEKRVKEVQESLDALGVTQLYNKYKDIINSSPNSKVEKIKKYFKLKSIEHKAAKLFNDNYYRYQETHSVHTRDLEAVFSDRDGIIINDVIDYGSKVDEALPNDVYIVYNPNQIKSATDNTSFSTSNNDIYKSEGPKLRRKNTWKELIKDNPALAKLDEKSSAAVMQFIEQHLKLEAAGATWRGISDSYFDMNTKLHTPNKSIRDMLDSIYENTTDNELKELISIIRPRITDNVGKIPVFYYNESHTGVRAFYEAVNQEVHVFKNAAFGTNRDLAKLNFERTIVHEIIHAMTVDYLDSNTAVRKLVADIMEHLDNAISNGDTNLKVYALKNPAEFIAEFMSKPVLREALKHIPYQRSNFFTRIVDAIKRLFGRKGTTAFDKASKLIDKIFEESAKYLGVHTEGTYNMETVKDLTQINTASELINKYVKTSNKLSEIVLNTAFNLGVKFVEKPLKSDGVSAISGRFVPNENTIYIDPNNAQENTLVHEAIHAVTSYYLKASDRKALPKEILVAINEIEYCYDLLKQDFIELHFYENGKLTEGVNVEKAFKFWIQEDDTYGYTSPEEMVAEIGKPSFLEHIKDFDRRHKNLSIFDKLVNSILSLFNISKKYNSLERTLKNALVTLILNPSKELYLKYNTEIKTIKDNYNRLNELGSNILTLLNASPVVLKLIFEAIKDTNPGEEATINIPRWVVEDIMFIPEGSTRVLTNAALNTILLVITNGSRGLLLITKPAKVLSTTEDGSVEVTVTPLDYNYLISNKLDIRVNNNNIAYVANFTPNSSRINSETKETTTLSTEKTKKEQESTQEQDKMLEQIYIINEQFNRILESKTLTSTDLAEVSDIIADMISSKIDEMEAKRDQVKEILVRRNPNDNTDVEKLSRFDLINSLGVQYFIDLVKQDFAKNRRTAIPENRAKINEVIKNWDYFINRIKSNISEAEGIHLEVSATGEKSAKADDTLVDQYDEEGNNIQDQVEDGQLSWQIENNTIDPVTSITQLVRLRLRGLYELRDNGRRSEDGSILYDHIKTKWGTDAKVGSTRAAKCLLSWLNNKPSVKEMVKVLESKSRKNPWVTPLISMLSDKSGDNVTEQSQFFCSFYKPFMKFTNVGTKDGMLVSRPLNEHPFLTLTIKTIEASYKLGQHPLIVKGLKAGAKALNNHYVTLQELTKNFEANKEAIFEELRAVTKGLGFEINVAELHLEEEEVAELMHQLNIINMVLERNADKADYDPFASGKNAEGVRSNFMRFFEKLTDQYEDEAVTSFYEGGKMRQSYLLPSFLTMFSNKFKLEDAAFNRFLVDEFNSEFMRNNLIEEGLSDADLEVAVKKGWNNVWLQHMVLDPKKRRNFGCKTSITFNGHTYMRGMSPEEYALSMITEFFGENSKETDSLFLANFRVPIEANKPSAEYITFYARGGVSYKEDLVGDFLNVFNQELCRIKTVILREKARTEKLAKLKELHDNERITTQQYNSLVYSVNQEAISRFDERGKTFVYLDFLNKEVQNGTKLGKLIEKVKNGEKVDQAELSKEASIAIEAAIKERVNNMIEKFKKNGVFESCKTIEKIGTSDKAVQEKLELMLWNDAFASTQIMQLLITDPAFLKDTDDVQKRFAQVHASGTRANISATYKGIEVSDGVHRSITLKDVTGLASNIIDNLTEVLDRKIEAARKANNRSEIIAWEAFKDKLVGDNGLYRKGINLTDAQAYSCPSSYRKKAIMFGEWSDEKEATYNRIKDGNYTYSDVASVFQPFKPFVYGNSIESTGVNAEGAMTKMRVPVQNKNAECLLVMADAILAGEETGRPNLLRALFEVMEESHYDTVRGEDGSITRTYKTNGIDTVNFESAVKSGAQGRIDTQAYASGKETLIETSKGETKTLSLSHENAFKGQLRSLIYNTETVNGEEVTSYNRNTVKHLSFEYYCMQQSVPEHFLDHAQLEGSQQRALTPSDLATTTIDENGQIQTVYYEVGENKVKMTAEQLRERYDQVHADIIQKGIDEINELFKLKDSSPQERREALSELLVEQFLKDGRYSGDMLYMVTLNRETGDFPVSLEDSSIRTQVEQAINSIIKSRVNKIKMPGGPLVQMSNFGMSKELKIRFLDKDGNPLKDRSAFESDEAYKEYVSKNQKGIAHWEVIAPAYTETIFREFMDKEGNISVEALEMLSPELLKMIGYRIPTEAKYSIAPLKIVGFAPREMGDVIILPAEITLVNGSDFDVDKEYCIRKALEIIHKIGLSAEEKNLSKEEQTIIRSNKAAARLANELSNLNREVKGISKYSTIRAFAERFVNDPFNKKLWMSAGFTEAQYKDILKRYVNIMYSVVPTKEVGTLKNEIFDMSYAVLTSEHTVAKALKPGGFEEHKLYGYAVAAYRLPEVRAKYPNFDPLLKMDTEGLGKLIEESGKNLIFLDTQLEYYDHNNSASSLLGISAVNSVAHAILVDDNIGLDLSDVEVPTIAGFQFNRYMRLDPSTAEDGASVAETLGSCVGASADAAKDPVMNLLNLTPQTFNVYTTLIRLGVPNPTACLLMSSKVLSDAIKAANAKVLTGEWASPESILREKMSIDELKKLGYSLDSPIFNEELTRDELIKGIHSDDINITLKISNALISLFTASKRIRLADQITRLNSTSSAVGPTTLDNYVFQSNLEALDSESYLVDLNTREPIGSREILEKHKMLAKFYQAYDLANSILINGMPQTRAFLESIEGICTQPTVEGLDIKYGLPSIVKNDRSLMGKLREFFTSWTAVKKGLVNYNELKFLSKELPLTLTAKKKEHADNYLVQNLYLDIDKRSGFPIISMNISKIEKESKNKLAASWAELYTKDKEFAINIFKYSFFRGGLGFSPKTFMNVLPIQMKLKMERYLDVYRHAEVLSDNEVSLFYKQFISNNYLDNKLVPIKKAKPGSDGKIAIAKESKNAYLFKNVRFFKIKDGSSYKLYEFVKGEEEGPIYRVYKEIPILGANGNFIELSTHNIDKSLFDLQFDLEDDGSMKSTPNVDDMFDDKLITVVEANKFLNNITSESQTLTKDESTVNEEAKDVLVLKASTRLLSMLKDKGYTSVELSDIDKILDDLNLC